MPAIALALCWASPGLASGEGSRCGEPQAQAVAAAEAATAAAASRDALWTVAVEALERAQAALHAGACERAAREAETAAALAALGMRQRDYPPYQIP